MKTPRLLALFVTALTLPLFAAEKTDLTLNNGRVIKAARIVSIGESEVSILSAAGSESVPVDLVPLDVLARAHGEIAAKAEQRKDATAKATAQAAQSDAKKNEELQIRMAEAKAREGTGYTPAPVSTESNGGARLATLKTQFPEKRKQTARVLLKNGYENIEIDVPHTDMWSRYRGMILTSSLQSLPTVLDQIEKRLTEDLDQLTNSAGASKSGKVQASRSSEWVRKELRPYLANLRAIAAAK